MQKSSRQKEIKEAQKLLPYIAWHKILSPSCSRAMGSASFLYLAANYKTPADSPLPPQVPEDFMPGEYLSIRRREYAARRYEEDLAAVIQGLCGYDPEPYLRAKKLYGQILEEEDDIAYQLVRLQGEARIGEKQARETLQRMGKTFQAERGAPKQYTPQERQARRKASTRRSSTKRNHIQTAQRVVKKIDKQTERNRQYGRTKERAKEEALRSVLAEWKENSRAKDKPAILALVKDLLKRN